MERVAHAQLRQLRSSDTHTEQARQEHRGQDDPDDLFSAPKHPLALIPPGRLLGVAPHLSFLLSSPLLSSPLLSSLRDSLGTVQGGTVLSEGWETPFLCLRLKVGHAQTEMEGVVWL